jgi:hypothetical protein
MCVTKNNGNAADGVEVDDGLNYETFSKFPNKLKSLTITSQSMHESSLHPLVVFLTKKSFHSLKKLSLYHGFGLEWSIYSIILPGCPLLEDLTAKIKERSSNVVNVAILGSMNFLKRLKIHQRSGNAAVNGTSACPTLNNLAGLSQNLETLVIENLQIMSLDLLSIFNRLESLKYFCHIGNFPRSLQLGYGLTMSQFTSLFCKRSLEEILVKTNLLREDVPEEELDTFFTHMMNYIVHDDDDAEMFVNIVNNNAGARAGSEWWLLPETLGGDSPVFFRM